MDLFSNEASNDQPSLKLRNTMGTVKLPKEFDEKKELTSYFEKKHL